MDTPTPALDLAMEAVDRVYDSLDLFMDPLEKMDAATEGYIEIKARCTVAGAGSCQVGVEGIEVSSAHQGLVAAGCFAAIQADANAAIQAVLGAAPVLGGNTIPLSFLMGSFLMLEGHRVRLTGWRFGDTMERKDYGSSFGGRDRSADLGRRIAALSSLSPGLQGFTIERHSLFAQPVFAASAADALIFAAVVGGGRHGRLMDAVTAQALPVAFRDIRAGLPSFVEDLLA